MDNILDKKVKIAKLKEMQKMKITIKVRSKHSIAILYISYTYKNIRNLSKVVRISEQENNSNK